jgi:hypothetical protein
VATTGKTIFTYVYIERILLLQNQQANFIQTRHKSFLVREILNYSNERPGPLQREIISKIQNGSGSFKNLPSDIM